jgi:hypothetical protein
MVATMVITIASRSSVKPLSDRAHRYTDGLDADAGGIRAAKPAWCSKS